MWTLKSDKAKIITIISFLVLGVLSMKIFAQEKNEVESKLDNLKGNVEKLTIKVDGKDVVFEDEDAVNMVKNLRAGTKHKTMFINSDDDMMEMENGNVMMFRSKGSKDFNVKLDNDKKKVKVEVEDGKKKITVTTMKDGKEETKVYEGEAAEKFLKEENGMKHFNIKIDGDEDMPKDHVMFYKQMDGNNCCCCCGGNKMVMRSHSSGKGMKHMIIKEFNDDDEKAEKKVEKKIEKE